jgi:nitrate/nitrite transporter NarK
MGLFYYFGVREQRPADVPVVRERPAEPLNPFVRIGHFLRHFARDTFGDHQMRMVYLLMFAAQGTWIGLGALAPLLFTDQFGYDKATYGKIVGYGTPVILIVAPIAGFLVDRCNRLKMFIWGSAILIAQKLLRELDIPGYALQTAGLFFLGGVQMLLLGILGEYIGRIYRQIQGRPLYVVREIITARDGTLIEPHMPRGTFENTPASGRT